MKYDGKIVIETATDTTGIKTGTKQIQGSLSKINSSVLALAKTFALVFGAGMLIKFGKEAVKLSSDLVEVQNVVDTAFGSMSNKIEEFSKTSIENFGISELTAKTMASTFLAMGNGIGQSLDVGSDAAVELTGRLADIMSFYNKTADEVNTIGRAIYSKEAEPLKQIGIIMTEDSLSAYALAEGYTTLYKNMSEADKLFVRQQYFLNATSQAAGDFVKTQDSWANQTRILSERWNQFLTLIGGGLTSTLAPVLSTLNTMLQRAIDVASAMSEAFGWVSETGNAASGISDVAEAEDSVAASTAGANSELSKQLASFDKLNVLSQSVSGGGGSSAVKTASDASVLQNQIDKTNESLSTLALLVERFEGGFADGFNDTFDPDKFKEIDENMKSIRNSINDIMTDKNVQMSALGLFDASAYSSGQIIGSFATIGGNIGAGITGGISDALSDEEFKALIADDLAGTFDNLTAITVTTGDFAEALGTVSNAFDSEAFQNIVEFYTKVTGSTIIDGIEKITGFTSDLFNLALKPFIDNQDGIEALTETLLKLYDQALEPSKELLDTMFKTDTDYEDTELHKIFLAAQELNSISMGEGIRIITDTVENLTDKLADLQERQEEVGRSWVRTQKKMADGATDILNSLIKVSTAFTNLLIDGINVVIDTINAIKFTVPDWIPEIGGRSFGGFEIPKLPNYSLPELAEGAVIPPNRRFAAILGDQTSGLNIETPLATMVDAFTQALDKRGGSGGQTIIMNIDGEEAARILVPSFVRELGRQGYSPEIIGG